jgi:polygalacturonase
MRRPGRSVTRLTAGITLCFALAAVLAAASSCPHCLASPPEGPFNVAQHGVTADGKTVCTQAIQALVDRCATQGGGTVYFPPGQYLSGTIVLKSNVTLQLESGATLLGSTNLTDYPAHVPEYRSYTDSYTDKSLIYAEKAEGIAIVGGGVIDGQGGSLRGTYKGRPYLIRLIECSHVRLRDVTLQRSAMWTLHLLASDDVVADSLRINTLPPINHNNDGIDVDSCRYVRIANCYIDTEDDAIVLKSTSPRPNEHITITNCVLQSRCNAFKMGTESIGGFRNIAVSNCAIYSTGLSGIALETVDGGDLDGVSINNLAMRGAMGNAIFVCLGNRARPYWVARPGDKPGDAPPTPGMGKMRNIVISNVQATGVKGIGCLITGLPGHAIENVTLSNIRLRMAGGGTSQQAARLDVPEDERGYPEFTVFGTLPAYGLYCRHASNVRLDGVDLSVADDDARPAVVCQDVRQLDLCGLLAQAAPQSECLVRLRGIDGALVHGCLQPAPLRRMIDQSEDCRGVEVIGNALPK